MLGNVLQTRDDNGKQQHIINNSHYLATFSIIHSFKFLPTHSPGQQQQNHIRPCEKGYLMQGCLGKKGREEKGAELLIHAERLGLCPVTL